MLDTTVAVIPGRINQVQLPLHRVTLQQDRGRIVVASNQAGASVSVDGRRVGVTPLDHPLATGRYRIEVTAEGFSPLNEVIQVQPGAATTINAELETLTSVLRVLVNPFGAIFLDNARVRGEEPGWYESTLTRGRHRLRTTHCGFGRWEKNRPHTGSAGNQDKIS